MTNNNNKFLPLVQDLPGRDKSASIRAAILQFIADYIDENGYSPSLNNVANGIGRSQSATRFQLAVLKEAGLVNYQPDIARTFVLGELAHVEANEDNP